MNKQDLLELAVACRHDGADGEAVIFSASEFDEFCDAVVAAQPKADERGSADPKPIAHVVEDIDGSNKRVAFWSNAALYDTPYGTRLYDHPAPTRDGSAEPECDKPPLGWRCTRGLGHEGPCAAVEDTRTVSEQPPHFAKGYTTGYADGVKDARATALARDGSEPGLIPESVTLPVGEVVALRRNAARYSVLREARHGFEAVKLERRGKRWGDEGSILKGDELDKQIDAARASAGRAK